MGKSVLYIVISRIIWVLSGFAIHVGLGRLLGPKLYGVLGVILSLISITYLILASGIRQAITKYTASNPDLVGVIKNSGLKIQVIFSLTLTIIFVSLSKPIAMLLNDETLVNFIRLSALTIPFSGILFSYVGSLEGIKRFGSSATISITHASLKVVFVFLLVFWGLQIYGAITGFILSVFVTTIVAAYFCRGQPNEGHFDSIILIKFGFPVLLFFIAIALLMNIDILFVKSILADNAKTGFYTSARALSQVIYFVFTAFSIVLLPSISNSIVNNDLQLTKKYINQSLRYILMLLIPTVLMISATSGELVTFFYSKSYIPAAYPLSILVFGISSLSITLALSTIMQGYGKPKIPLTILLILVPLDICLHFLMIPRFQLVGAALATSITCFIGLAISCIYVYKEFKTLVSINSLIKIILASTIVYLIALRFSFSGFLLPTYYLGLFVIYFLILLMLKEINSEDMSFIRDIFSRLQRKQEHPELPT